MAAKKLRRAQLSQEMCERLGRYQITTCQVKELFCSCVGMVQWFFWGVGLFVVFVLFLFFGFLCVCDFVLMYVEFTFWKLN